MNRANGEIKSRAIVLGQKDCRAALRFARNDGQKSI